MLLRMATTVLSVGLAVELSAQASRSTRVVLEPRHSIGEESGGDAEFARIEAVARDQQSGVLYILDSRLNEIRAFSATGSFVGLGGRPGQGPGELGVTGSLAVDPRGRIHVLDMSNMRISVFGRVDPAQEALPYQSTLRLPQFGRRMCLLGNDYVLIALTKDSLFHVVGPQGQVRSFGGPFRLQGTPPNPMLNQTLGQGYISCDAEGRLVFSASGSTGEVRAYGANGTLRWSLSLPDYRPANISMTPAGNSVSYQRRPGGWHRTIGVNRLRGKLLLVQAEFRTPESALGEPKRIDSYIIAESDGTILGAQTDLPSVIFSDDSVVVTTSEDPFPRVQVSTYRTELPRDRRK